MPLNQSETNFEAYQNAVRIEQVESKEAEEDWA